MKSTRYLVAVPALLALALAGCGGSTGNSDTPAATGSSAAGAPADDSNCASADVYCVGLVTDTGKVDDKSFNQSAHEGAKAAAAQTNGFYKYIETQDAKDYAANIQQFTNKKYDTIVTVGFLMADATTAAAKANPTTRFIGVDQGYDAKKVTEKNITGLIFPEDQAGYGAGYLAGLMTKTNKLGQVLGLEIPPVQKYAKGFEAAPRPPTRRSPSPPCTTPPPTTRSTTRYGVPARPRSSSPRVLTSSSAPGATPATARCRRSPRPPVRARTSSASASTSTSGTPSRPPSPASSPRR
jgi:hypothetical protein